METPKPLKLSVLSVESFEVSAKGQVVAGKLNEDPPTIFSRKYSCFSCDYTCPG